MNKENKTYIAGIFNYCDRWCEKCQFTSNCSLFATESRIAAHQILNNGEMPKAEDIFPRLEEFNENSEDELTDEEDDEILNFDESVFDEIDEDYENEREERKKYFELNKSTIEILTNDYLNKSHTLIKKLIEKYNFSEPRMEMFNDAGFKEMYDSFDVFSYYHIFIHIKFKRALHGKFDILKEDNDDMKEIHAYDMNGTAKIATISVNNSLEALNKLYDIMPEFNTDIGELLVILGKIKNETENEFPDCMSFKRPGLDD